MDMHTHFLRDDTRLNEFVRMREAVGKSGWNKDLASREQTIEDLKFANYIKEMFLDSDTKIALHLQRALRDRAGLVPDQRADGRRARQGQRARPAPSACYTHAIFTPGQPGWLDKLDAALALKPDSWKGYTIGDNTHKDTSRYPWRMDDEKVDLPGLREDARRPASRTSACTRACSRRPSRSSSRTCAASSTSTTSARRPRTGRSSTSSSITRPIARSAATRPMALAEFERTGPHRVDHRPRGNPGAIRRQQRLRRSRPAVRRRRSIAQPRVCARR